MTPCRSAVFSCRRAWPIKQMKAQATVNDRPRFDQHGTKISFLSSWDEAAGVNEDSRP